MNRFRTALIAIGIGFLLVVSYFFLGIPSVDPSTVYGVTWSATYAKELGIDSQKGLEAVLDDLGVRRFRIPSYWNLIEAEQGKRDFSALRKQLDAIAERGGKAIVVVGATQPRWPECWLPEWTKEFTPSEREPYQMDYVKDTVKQFANHPALEAWQVENETSLFSFGNCKDQRKEFIADEMVAVRRADEEASPKQPHPVYTADSGEMSLWLGFHSEVDGKGVSTYRTVRAPGGKLVTYYLPPFFYARHAALIKPWIKTVFVSEFQMEPWEERSLTQVAVEDQLKDFSLEQMQKNFGFAERMHMPSVYFWGVEWWYWMKEQKSHPEFWDAAKNFLAQRAR